MQALPLSVKVRMTETRIRQWVNHYGEDGVYVSFSGGKDSTVLLDIVRDLYPDIPAMFVNTGLEFPEIQQFVKTFNNVEVIRPRMGFNDVIKNFGYPMLTKEVSQTIYYARRNPKSEYYKKLFGDEKYKGGVFDRSKWQALCNIDFIIGSRCCQVMKKNPAHSYGSKSKRNPMTAQMADESLTRRAHWLHKGCNSFAGKHPLSNPMAFWTEQDVLRYIKENNLPIASVYGDVVQVDADGFIYESSMLPSTCPYTTTGCKRTGCIFCGYGAHLEKGEGRFRLLKRTHPKQYDYCMGGGGTTLTMDYGNQQRTV